MAQLSQGVEMLKNKLVQKLQNTKFLKELREFDSLIKAIGECKSKSEEDRIILAEIETLRQRLADPKIDKSRGREYMVRLIYCEMLGHDVSWAYVKAVQFASEPNILTKKAAYLALTQFFDQSHELVLLLVNTLLSDLKSDNFINVTTALVVCTKLIGPDLINAVYPLVVDRLRHPKEAVRKKAVMALHRFHQLDPRREGPLAGVEVDKHIRTMLCDKDPSVMSAALCALHDVVKAGPTPYRNLIPSFTSILKQVSEHRLPKSYDYHRYPAPFIQIKLLKILALLGAGDRVASENMYAVVQQTLRRANSNHTIGNAIIFECVTTITSIFPNPHLLAAAAEAVAAFLRAPSHNLRYVGIDALAGIIKINPQAAQDHQLAVVDCLEDPDDTLKLKTLELLYKMTKASNVEVIVERMITYLRTVTDEHIKRDITRKVSELAERYAPSPAWFIQVVSEVCELGGEHVEPGLAHSLTRLIAEQDTELHRSAVEQYSKLLDVPSGRNLPEVLLQVMVWVLGEYGVLLASGTSTVRPLMAQQLMSKLVALVTRQKCSDGVRQLLLPALTKLAVQGRVTQLPNDVQSWVHKSTASQSVELQQRAYELLALLTAPAQVQQAVLPHDASCEEIDGLEMAQLKDMAFLTWYVDKALQAGAAPYARHHSRATPAVSHEHTRSGGALRFQAYELAPAASSSSGAAAGSSSKQHTPGGSGTYDADGAHLLGAAASSSGPQLLHVAGRPGAGKWGPAQFECATAPSTSAASPAPSRPSGRGASGSESAALAAVSPLPSARDRLAASLFSGMAAGGASGSSAWLGAVGDRAAAPPAAPAPDLLLLDDGPSLPPVAATSQAAGGGLDLLMDLAGPASAEPAPPPAGELGGGLDSLLGDLGPVPAVPQLGGLGVGTTVGGGSNLLGGLSLAGVGVALPHGGARPGQQLGMAPVTVGPAPGQGAAWRPGAMPGGAGALGPMASLGLGMGTPASGLAVGPGIAIGGGGLRGHVGGGATSGVAFQGLAQAQLNAMQPAAAAKPVLVLDGAPLLASPAGPTMAPAADPFADLI